MTDPLDARERIAAMLQRILEVYPLGRNRCAWCQVKQPDHDFDCPVLDVHFLLDQLAQREAALHALGEAQEQIDQLKKEQKD